MVLWVRRAPASPRHNRGRIPVLLVVAMGLSSDRPPHHPGRINSLNHSVEWFPQNSAESQIPLWTRAAGRKSEFNKFTLISRWLQVNSWLLVCPQSCHSSKPPYLSKWQFFFYVCIFHEWICFATSFRYIQSRLLRSKPPCVCMDYIVAF